MAKIRNAGTATMKFGEGAIVSGSAAQPDGTGSDFSLIVSGAIKLEPGPSAGITFQKTNDELNFIQFKNEDDGTSFNAYLAYQIAEHIYISPGRGADFYIQARTNVGGDPFTFPFRVMDDGTAKFQKGLSDSATSVADLPGDVAFFVSGSKDGQNSAVFTGDVVVSGSIKDGAGNTYSTGGGGGSPAGADTQIQFNNGGSSFGASSNLTWDDTELKISGTGTSALLNLQTTEDSSTASPVLELKRLSSSPADADYLGQIKFIGKHDGNGVTTYAKITGKIDDASENSEDGIIEFANVKAGSQTITARLRSDSLQLLNGTSLTVDGNVGVGTTQPQTTVHIHSDSIHNGTVMISQADDSVDASQLDLSKARGTGESPTVLQNGDFVGQVRMLGYNGSDYHGFADIYAQTAGTITNSSHPTKIVIRTTPLNQTSPVEALTIDDNQNLIVVGTVYGKMIHMTHHRYSDTSASGKEYIPFAGSTAEQASPSSIAQTIAPYDGRLVKVMIRSANAMGTTSVSIHKNTDGNAVINTSATETRTIFGLGANTTTTFAFTASNHFSAGDIIGVSVDPFNNHGNVNVTCVWEYNVTS